MKSTVPRSQAGFDPSDASRVNALVERYPANWHITHVGGIAKIKGGKRLPKGDKFADESTLFPYIRVTDFADFSVDTADLRFLRPDTQAAIRRYTISKDDVYISIAGTIGVTGMIPPDLDGANLTENAAKLVLDSEAIDSRYLMLCLASSSAQNQIRSQTVKNAQPKLALARIASLTIPVPPLPEQQKIAAVLGVVQRAMEQQERLLALTAELKKTLLQQLFTQGLPSIDSSTGGLRHEPQKQTDIGPVPESWEVVTLGEVSRIERGKFSHRPRNDPRLYGGNIPFVQTGDVSACDGRIRSFSQTLNDQGLQVSKVFPAGTILITIAANIGFSGILDFASACPDSLIGLTPSDRLNVEFLQHHLTTQQPIMDRLAPRGTQKNINIEFLRPWPVPLPSLDEQLEIVESLNAVDARNRLARRKHTTLTALFRTLLHQLMTAQIRVDHLLFENTFSTQ